MLVSDERMRYYSQITSKNISELLRVKS